MTELYHLLVWDEDMTPEEDMDAYQRAAYYTRVVFREQWAAHKLSAAYLMDSPDTDADTALDGLVAFLHHIVGDGEHLHPIIGTSADIALLRLACGSPVPPLFFPLEWAQSRGASFPTIAEIVASAALTREADKYEKRLERVYLQLNHMFGVADQNGLRQIHQSLCDLFAGELVADEEGRA